MLDRKKQDHLDHWSSVDDGESISLVKSCRNEWRFAFTAKPRPVLVVLSRSALVDDAITTVSPRQVSDAISYIIRLLRGFTAALTDILAAMSSTLSTGDKS